MATCYGECSKVFLEKDGGVLQQVEPGVPGGPDEAGQKPYWL